MDMEYFENNYWEEYNEEDNNEDALACIYIDGFPKDANKEGQVVAKVWITKHKDIIVDWHDNRYKTNDIVLELIKESKNKLREEY